MLHSIRSMNWKMWDSIGSVLGLFGGGTAFLKFPMLGIHAGNVGHEILQYAWSLLWAGILAAFGRMCAKMVEERWDKIKSIFKRKNKM